MARAELATMEIQQSRSTEQVDQTLSNFRESLSVAAAQIEAAKQRATRAPVIEGYRTVGALVNEYLTAGAELGSRLPVGSCCG